MNCYEYKNLPECHQHGCRWSNKEKRCMSQDEYKEFSRNRNIQQSRQLYQEIRTDPEAYQARLQQRKQQYQEIRADPEAYQAHLQRRRERARSRSSLRQPRQPVRSRSPLRQPRQRARSRSPSEEKKTEDHQPSDDVIIPIQLRPQQTFSTPTRRDLMAQELHQRVTEPTLAEVQEQRRILSSYRRSPRRISSDDEYVPSDE